MLDKALSMSACLILIFSLNTGFYNNNNKKHFHLPQLAESSNKALSIKFQVSGNKAGSSPAREIFLSVNNFFNQNKQISNKKEL
jgi:hypothetical protein